MVESADLYLYGSRGGSEWIHNHYAAMGAMKCPGIYKHASSMLNEEMGSLPMKALGIFTSVEALSKDGDSVRVTGLVHVLKSKVPRDTRSYAAIIQILGPRIAVRG